jgi:hypothetical protein
LNTVAIYYPNAAAAQRVLDAYVESDRVTHFDIFLSTHRLVTHFWFPNCFAELIGRSVRRMHSNSELE